MIDLYIDAETYYDKDYSLSKMPTHAYLRDPRFVCYGASVAFGNDEPVWLEEAALREFLSQVPWGSTRAVCHNAGFDLSLLFEKYGYRPAAIRDTMLEARYLIAQDVLPTDIRTSLASLASLVGMQKGDTAQAVNAGGEELARYATNDLVITQALARLFDKTPLPQLEQDLIDLHVRMMSEPVFELDEELLRSIAEEQPSEEQAWLRSKENFAAALRALGIEPETKPGKKGPQYAFAKDDGFMQRLASHENEVVRQLVDLRINGNSSIERTRAERFLAIGSPMPVPLLYYGCHTGRNSGSESLNMLNLPARMGEPRLRRALLAPEGYSMAAPDSGQIEVRVLAWDAGDERTLQLFRDGRDVYRDFAASDLYRVSEEDITKHQRDVAKSAVLALGYAQKAKGFREYCRKRKIVISIVEAEKAVRAYERSHPAQVRLWNRVEKEIRRDGFTLLPSGRKIIYPELRHGSRGLQYTLPSIFRAKENPSGATHAWHGGFTNNRTQGIARDLVMAQTIRIHRELREVKVALSVYDEAACVFPTKYATELMRELQARMTWVPEWAEGLPVASDIHLGRNYAEAKGK